jgi:hypothetical protein
VGLSKTDKAIIQDAIAEISRPYGWVRGYDARLRNGEEVSWYEKAQNCGRCARGAILYVAYTRARKRMNHSKAYDHACKVFGRISDAFQDMFDGRDIVDINDRSKKKESIIGKLRKLAA